MWLALARTGVLREIDEIARELLPEYVSESAYAEIEQVEGVLAADA